MNYLMSALRECNIGVYNEWLEHNMTTIIEQTLSS